MRVVPQLRLIAQVPPIAGFDGGLVFPSFVDQAIHLVYALDPSVVPALERDLRTLKSASPARTSGVPLGVHPGLAQAGLESSYAELVELFVQTYAGDSGLVRIALALVSNEADWFFTAVTVDQGTFSLFVVPGTTSSSITVEEAPILPPPPTSTRTTVVGFEDAGVEADAAPTGFNEFVGSLAPTPIGTDSIAFGQVTAGTPAYAADVDTLLRLDNPTTTDDVFHVDCVSCHMASRVMNIMQLDAGGPNAFAAPPGVTGAHSFGDGASCVVRAFGYDPNSTTPAITDRTVNESAQIAAQLQAQGL